MWLLTCNLAFGDTARNRLMVAETKSVLSTSEGLGVISKHKTEGLRK